MPQKCVKCGKQAITWIQIEILVSSIGGVKKNEEKQHIYVCEKCEERAHKVVKESAKQMVKQLLSRVDI